MKPIIAITMGDPGGIGPEIILKSLQGISPQKAVYMVIGSGEVFQFASDRLKLPIRFHVIPTLEPSFLSHDQVNLLDITEEAKALFLKVFGEKHSEKDIFSVGQVSKWNAALAFTSLKVAAYQASCGLVHGLATAPVSKSAVRLVDPKFSGHTDYLAKISKTKDYAMMFVSDRMRVTLATIHIPITSVAKTLTTPGLLAKIKLTDDFLKKHLGIKAPRIGVAALNPHGKEFGREDEDIILPAVKAAGKQGIQALGPLPGDQIFYDHYEGRLDAVVAMYHDQGLAPFKMVAFREGVNVTVGLPFLRTSPDHGTAFDIAYQNKAFHTAFQNSLSLLERALG